MPPDDWPRGSAAQSTTWHSYSCTPHEDHATTRAVVPHRSCRCAVRCHKFYCEWMMILVRSSSSSSSTKHTATIKEKGRK
jgi:hypothetical protein